MRQEIAVIKIVYLEHIIGVTFVSIHITLCYQAFGLLAFDVILKRPDLVQTQDLAP